MFKFKNSLFLCSAAMCLLSGPVLAQQNSSEYGQLTDAMAQTSGSFDSMDLGYLTSLGMQQKAWNDPLQHLGEGQLKPGYSRYVWTPDVVLPLRLREGMMTLINLPTWELIEKVHIGSPESFGGEIAAPNSLLLYADPAFIGVDSNLIIFGRSGNRYVFYLRSETFNTDRITNAVVDVLVSPKYTPVAAGGQSQGGNGVTVSAANSQWVGKSGGSTLTAGGPQNPTMGLATAANAPKNWLENIPVDPEKFRFDIDVYIPNPEDLEIAPERVWRDDIFTYIDFGPKALNMTQRPVVQLLVQDSETPVGFRTKGEHSRLLVVEGIGDMVLRNGQRVVCLKLRRDPSQGLENIDYSGSNERIWKAEQPSTVASAPMAMVMGSEGQFSNPYATAEDADRASRQFAVTSNLPPVPSVARESTQASAGILDVMNSMTKGTAVQPATVDNIAVELGLGTDLGALEETWENIQAQNKALLKGYNPYYSMDTVAEGGMPDLFRLRIGPVEDVKTGDALCKKLSRKGVSCSVIRTQ